MKKQIFSLLLGCLCMAGNVLAADGDLIVNGKVSVGSTSLTNKLYVYETGSGGDGASVRIEDWMYSPAPWKPTLLISSRSGSSTQFLGRFLADDGIDVLDIMCNGNVGIGGFFFGAGSSNVLGLVNGFAPSSSPANMVQLYAQDVASLSELKVRDEAGNVTTLSPHNFTLFGPDPSHFLPWSYYSRNDFLGREINVDMYGAIREIEKLSGKKFIYERSFAPVCTWEQNQEEQRQRVTQMIESLQAKIAELETKLEAITDEKGREQIEREKKTIKIPDTYLKKQPPQWVKERM